jgi:hypothetical protein
MGAGMPDEVIWRVSPQVFSDLMEIIGNHLAEKTFWEEYAKQFGQEYAREDKAALEIREKYNLNHLPFGTEVKVIVDCKMDGYDKPEYEGEENAKFNRSDSGTV